MDIRFVSSLTSEDENLFAPALLKAVAALLDQLPIAYTLRIETTASQVFQHTHTVPDEAPSHTAAFGAAGLMGNLSSVAAPYGRRLAK